MAAHGVGQRVADAQGADDDHRAQGQAHDDQGSLSRSSGDVAQAHLSDDAPTQAQLHHKKQRQPQQHQ